MAKPFPRSGAWTTVGNKVGIIANLDGDAAEVHFVDAKGETTEMVGGVPVGSLTQARFMQIPKARRPAKDVGAAHGYE